MWDSLEAARVALTRDGWTRDTAYWFHKRVSGGRLELELDWVTIDSGPLAERVLMPQLQAAGDED